MNTPAVFSVVLFLAVTLAGQEGAVVVFSGWDYRQTRTKWDIYRLMPNGEAKVLVNTGASEIYPFPFPNERAFGYLMETPGTERRPVFKYNLDSGASADTGILIRANSTCQASPDGRKIACADAFPSYNEIVVFDLETKARTQITEFKTDCLDPSWSPDGRNLVYWLGAGSVRVGNEQKPRGNHLAIYSFETKQHRLLTRAPNAYDAYPRWSPDGEWICFHKKEKGWNIWIIRPDGTGLTQLTTGSRESTHPSWSPDSKLVYFQSYRSGKSFDVWAVDIVNRALTQVTQTNKLDEHQPVLIR